jgi:hypothetical protein
MSVRTSSAFIAGAIAALVLGTGTAYAANGGVFRLGRANSATHTTTLTDNHGTALQLNSKVGQPSLRVNRSAKVPLLNSDLLDGIDSSGYAQATKLGSFFDTGYVDNGDPSDPNDDAVVAAAVCPTGSQVVGGGGGDFTTDGTIVYSSPESDGVTDAWVVVSSTSDLTQANADNLEAYARCWNPHKDLAGNMIKTQAKHTLSPAARQAVKAAAAKN